MMAPHSHKRAEALGAVVEHLNAARAARQAQAETEFLAVNPESSLPAFLENAPILPVCRLDDPTTLPDEEGKISRSLVLFTNNVRSENAYMGGGVEAALSATLEWILLVPPPFRNVAIDYRDRGLAEIEAALAPSETHLVDLQTGVSRSISFEIGNVDFTADDVGAAWALGSFISLSFILDATTSLS